MTNDYNVSVVTGPAADELEVYAANELCRYLQSIYGINTHPVTGIEANAKIAFFIGNPKSNPAVNDVSGITGWPDVSEQGIVLKRGVIDGTTIFILGGGSARATLWAVYDFIKHLGVCFLLEKDVLPENPPSFPPDELDVVIEPQLHFRSYRGVNDLATSLVFFGIDDYRHLIDQLAKMKFNVFYLQIYPFQPFVHYEYRGQKKTTGVIHYGWKLPIHSQTIGKELFQGKSEYMNPDMEKAENYEERNSVATEMLHRIFTHAKSRGMETGLMFIINQFTDEFNRRLPEWSDHTYVPEEHMKGTYSGRLGVEEVGVDPIAFPYLSPENPVVIELNKLIIRTTINTYPEVDYYGIYQKEMPNTGEEYLDFWHELNCKYELESDFKLEEMIESAKANTLPQGVRQGERPVAELKASIAYAHLLDKLINEEQVFEGTANPDATIIASTHSDEFYPVMEKIFGGRIMLQMQMDYFPSLAAKRTEMLAFAAKSSMRVGPMTTLADDNIGILPQVTVPSLHRIFEAMKKYKVTGFFGRNFLVTKLEVGTAYLAQSSWSADITPEAIYRDQVSNVCGAAVVQEMLNVYSILGETTIKAELLASGLIFPVPAVVRKHWTDSSGPDPNWNELANQYRTTLPLLESAYAKSRPEGKRYVEQLLGQVKFSVAYIESVQAIRSARTYYDSAQQARNDNKATDFDRNMAEADKLLNQSLDFLKTALSAWATAIRDPADLGALAFLNHYGYDYLKGLSNDVYIESHARRVGN